MSQIFPKSANAWSKASIIAVVALLGTLGAALPVIQRSDFVTTANTFRDQPVQFSHQHHVGGIGIDCRYCHTSVEVSSSAGIPPTKTCINCHSQIWSTSPYLEPIRSSFRDDTPLRWLRVHDLPDFVYFNHSIHVKKGMGCETCHGRVDKMPLMRQQNSLQMEWCLNCHRNPEKYVRPRAEVFTMGYTPAVDQSELGPQLVADYKIQSLTNCSVCHR
ncbi:MAG: cytochrome c3 family protein [Vicinamibacterales bacterium]